LYSRKEFLEKPVNDKVVYVIRKISAELAFELFAMKKDPKKQDELIKRIKEEIYPLMENNERKE
jgi:hypothetical protein